MDDIDIVMDAAASKQAAVFGSSETGLPAMLFAATHPGRAAALILHAPYARYLRGPNYPFGMPEDVAAKYVDAYRVNTGTGALVDFMAPRRSDDESFRRWWARGERLGGAPSTVARIYEMFMRTDVTEALASIQCPTLLVRRTGDWHVRTGHARYIAERVPHARLVELPGDDHVWFSGDIDEIFDEIEAFLTGVRAVAASNRALATVMFTDIVDSTSQAAALRDASWSSVLSSHDNIVRSHVDAYRGKLVKSTGDGALATFDGPARAIHCASGICDAVRILGIEVRAGLHTGEIEQTDSDIHGIAVHIAARVASTAQPSEVLVSRTVTDLVAGSGIRFETRGPHRLKGVPDEWELLSVVST